MSLAVPATAVPLSATARARIATIIDGVKRLPFNIFRVLSVTRYPAARCRGLDESKVRVTTGRSLDPFVPTARRREQARYVVQLHVPLARKKARDELVEQVQRHSPEHVPLHVYPFDLEPVRESGRREGEASAVRRIAEHLD